MSNSIPHNWLPTPRWEELLRERNKSAFNVKIAHIDPWPSGNQEFIHPKSIQEDETHTTIIVGSERRSGLGGGVTAGAQLKGAREVAELVGEMGRALGMEELVQKAEALKREEHKARKEVEKFEIVAPVPEKYDYYGFITISEMDDEKTAEQTLENTRLLPTAGPLDLPVPGGRTTVREALKSDAMKGFMTEEQIKAAEAAMGEMEKEIKTKFPKEVKFQRGKYQGADVVFAEGESERPTPLNVKESEDINKVFHSARVGRFIISGDLLRTVNAFSLGASSCDSLHEFETETDVMSEGGMTFYTKTIRPVKSTLVKEGYLYKEEIDEIFRTVFVALGSDPKVPPNMKNEL